MASGPFGLKKIGGFFMWKQYISKSSKSIYLMVSGSSVKGKGNLIMLYNKLN